MGVPVISEKDAMRKWSRDMRRAGKTIGFVPTMVRGGSPTGRSPAPAGAAPPPPRGADAPGRPRPPLPRPQGFLHEGHLSLVRHARERCDAVVASLYVNPTQFSVAEDFGVYPSDRAGDLAKLREAGCDVAFCPPTLYHETAGSAGEAGNLAGAGPGGPPPPGAHETWVEVTRLQRGLCGGSRPHFFRGVATVVAKLFHIVEPDVAVFGRKDYQQFRLVERMARDLDFGVEVVGLPTVREADGLAMSSRNARLAPGDRERAAGVSRALRWAAGAIAAGEVGDAGAAARGVAERVAASGGRVDYVEVRDARELTEVPAAIAPGREVVVAVAAHFGDVRLIDNIDCQAPARA